MLSHGLRCSRRRQVARIGTTTSGQTPLLSRFVGAFSPGSPTGLNNSGLKLVPVGPRTGTEEAPRGQVRSEGGEGALVPVDSKNRDQRGCTVSAFFIYFIFVFCIQLNGTIYI